MKKSLPVDSDRPAIGDIFSQDYIGHCSDQDLHRLLQDLIDTDLGPLIEIGLIAWHDAVNLMQEQKLESLDAPDTSPW